MRVAVLLLFFLLIASCAQKENTRIQNVLFIIGDDHSTRVLGAYGNKLVRTPNLDRLADTGVRFTHAYANAPMCSASRQSFLTGLYPHSAGVTLLHTSFPEEKQTLAEHLKRYGYNTAAIGKMHFNNNGKHGFDTLINRQTYRLWLDQHQPAVVPDSIPVRPAWRPFRDSARIWLNAEARPGKFYDRDDIGTFYAQTAINYLEEKKNEPFTLWLSFHEPHSPFNFPVEYRGRYQPADMPMPESSPEDDRWIPRIFRGLTPEERKGIISAYYTSVEYLDKNVGLVLDKLEQLGLDENTLVIYIGDHGYLLNDHKRFEKHTMWEPAINAPLLIRAGDRFEKGKISSVLTEFVDLAPTILDILQIDTMDQLQGKSLYPVLKGETDAHKQMIFSEFLADNKAMIRTRSWKYIFTTGQRDLQQGYATGLPPPGITHRLYNLAEDPAETTNVADHPENTAILHGLQQNLLKWFRNTHPAAERVPDTLSVEEQLVEFCEPPENNADAAAW